MSNAAVPPSATPKSVPARRKPGTGFPVVPLPEAAEIVRKAGKYGFEHSVSSFARYMGHQTTNSGAFRQRLAAFRDWKLIAGRGDTLVFTDTAKTIALPRDLAAERDALQTAFMSCVVFAQLYEGVAKGQPVDAQGLGAKAVHELGIAPSAVDRFTRSFIESAVAAQLAVTDGSEVILQEPDQEPGEAPDHPQDAPQDLRRERGSEPARPASMPPAVRQEWTLPGGSVIVEVRFDRALPAGVFAQIAAVVKEAEELARQLTSTATAVADG